ncbi:hypothetical protein CKAH01_15322 [Colletotrichum kahawae]|uniref:Uncharacterized protein n=1 Tax=Colletotrichum kahawae TaxID=34407 RepID=A0AAE0D6Z9_COLKA|nr:hypothetical protein CKAH01_15322 [Colletotrichum kahawae]
MEDQIVGQSPTTPRPFFDPVRDALFVNESKIVENYQQTPTDVDEIWRPNSSRDSPDTEYQHQGPNKKKKKSTRESGQQVFQFLSISHPKEARLFRTKIRSHAAQNPNAREKRVAGLKPNLPKRLAPDFKAEGSLCSSNRYDEDTLQSTDTTWRLVRPQTVPSIQSSSHEILNENPYEEHASRTGAFRDYFQDPAPRPVDLSFNEELARNGNLSSSFPRQFQLEKFNAPSNRVRENCATQVPTHQIDAARPKGLNSLQQSNIPGTWQPAEVGLREFDKYQPDCEITEEEREERVVGRCRKGA